LLEPFQVDRSIKFLDERHLGLLRHRFNDFCGPIYHTEDFAPLQALGIEHFELDSVGAEFIEHITIRHHSLQLAFHLLSQK